MDNSLAEFLMSQIKTLTEQNKILMEQNIALMEQNNELSKQITSKPIEKASPTLKDMFLKNQVDNLNQDGYDWDYFMQSIKTNLASKDIKFHYKDYSSCIFDIIVRLLNLKTSRPIYTLSKKNKIVVLYKNNKWNKICFDDFVAEVKLVINTIIQQLLTKFRFHIPRAEYDETLLVMVDDTNKYKEHIANKLLEYCKIIL